MSIYFETYTADLSADVIALVTSTFTDSAGSQEGTLVGGLVKELVKTTDMHDLYGYVAKEGEQIIGSVFFSRMKFNNNDSVFILAPMAVATSYQQQGIGQSLIRFAIDELKQKQVDIIFTYGDPAFYSRTGFQKISQEIARPPYPLTQPEGWLAQSLTGKDISPLHGQAVCVDALRDGQYW